MTGNKGNLLPVYVLADESGSMRPHIDELNRGLASLHEALLGEPMAAAKVRFSILRFADTCRNGCAWRTCAERTNCPHFLPVGAPVTGLPSRPSGSASHTTWRRSRLRGGRCTGLRCSSSAMDSRPTSGATSTGSLSTVPSRRRAQHHRLRHRPRAGRDHRRGSHPTRVRLRGQGGSRSRCGDRAVLHGPDEEHRRVRAIARFSPAGAGGAAARGVPDGHRCGLTSGEARTRQRVIRRASTAGHQMTRRRPMRLPPATKRGFRPPRRCRRTMREYPRPTDVRAIPLARTKPPQRAEASPADPLRGRPGCRRGGPMSLVRPCTISSPLPPTPPRIGRTPWPTAGPLTDSPSGWPRSAATPTGTVAFRARMTLR